MNGELGLGFLLNLVFWVGMVSALVIAGAWAAAEWFPGTAHKVRNRVRGRLGRNRSSSPPEASERQVAGEPYKKAS
ncbi:MAG: hypothetical protein C3F14_04695 [Deltaproteobacteria bacterium]|nr:MAG: hypothetical protein C3F14_04695 [Deltaproteobacteria bacterium]